jgi:VRR-NUC domain
MNGGMLRMLPDVSEAEWQGQVTALAGYNGWRYYHTHDSRRSVAGFPDLVLVRAPRLIFAELKSRTGRISPAQQQWIDQLNACGDIEAFIWRPEHIDQVRAVLSRRHQELPVEEHG